MLRRTPPRVVQSTAPDKPIDLEATLELHLLQIPRRPARNERLANGLGLSGTSEREGNRAKTKTNLAYLAKENTSSRVWPDLSNTREPNEPLFHSDFER